MLGGFQFFRYVYVFIGGYGEVELNMCSDFVGK